MPTGNLDLANLDRLHAAAGSSLIASNTWSIASHNEYPAIRDRIRELEGEVEAMRSALSEIYYRAMPLGEDRGHSTISDIAGDAVRGKSSSLVTARDVRMKRLGAAEWLEKAAANALEYSVAVTPELLEEEAKRLREGA